MHISMLALKGIVDQSRTRWVQTKKRKNSNSLGPLSVHRWRLGYASCEKVYWTAREILAKCHVFYEGHQTIAKIMTTLFNTTNAMPLEALLRMIRNAILVTEELHIRLLWVDSLCIMQYENWEREREITLMAAIYKFPRLPLSLLIQLQQQWVSDTGAN